MKERTKIIITGKTNEYIQSCAEFLENKGFDISLVSKDGNEVIDCLNCESADVIIMEPFLSGTDALGVLDVIMKNNGI